MTTDATATARRPALNERAIVGAVRAALLRNLSSVPPVIDRHELTLAEGELALRLVDAVRIGRISFDDVALEHDLEDLAARAEAL
jgi:hypothetical protein